MRLQLANPSTHPRIATLPFARRLDDWDLPDMHGVPGLHRHVVRLIELGDISYVVKELPDDLAMREYRLLRELAEDGLPTAEVVGVVTGKPDDDDGMLITRHLDYALPYRSLLSGRGLTIPYLGERLLDALVGLLVRLHLAGFFWGDCSLSNTLFRRDAGRLSAYLVDTETGELYDELSSGQREMDVDLAIEKCAGELLDLQAAGILSPNADPFELGEELRQRYHGLWAELTSDEVFGDDERFRIHERLRRINDLGYDVDELELLQDEPGVTRMKLKTSVVEPGRYRRILRDLTGLDAQDHQARRLLNDVHNFGAWLQQKEGRPLPEAVIAHRWRERSFEPSLAAVPEELRGRRDPVEVFHEVLEYWHHWSAEEGADLDLPTAVSRYVDEVLTALPEERRIAPAEGDVEVEDDLLEMDADTGPLDRDAVREAAEADPRTT